MTTLKLNLGSGHDYKEGWFNIDVRGEIKHPITGKSCRPPDLATSITKNKGMLFPENSIAEILASDILEHFVVSEGLMLLRAWIKMLQPRGEITIQVPDVNECVSLARSKQWTWDEAIRRIFGGQEYKGNFHLWGFTAETIQEIVKKVGFEILSSYHINGNVVVKARKL